MRSIPPSLIDILHRYFRPGSHRDCGGRWVPVVGSATMDLEIAAGSGAGAFC